MPQKAPGLDATTTTEGAETAPSHLHSVPEVPELRTSANPLGDIGKAADKVADALDQRTTVSVRKDDPAFLHETANLANTFASDPDTTQDRINEQIARTMIFANAAEGRDNYSRL
jgi:hypothetical protein